MSRADFTRSAFRSILARTEPYGLHTFGGEPKDGEENPGQASLYPSIEETQAYARKVDRLSQDVLKWYEAKLGDPKAFTTAQAWNSETHFAPSMGHIGDTWLDVWHEKYEDIVGSWWGAVDEYDTVSAFHAELREYCERAKKMGLKDVPIVGRESRYTDTGAVKGLQAGADLATIAIVGGLGLGLVYLLGKGK